MSTFDYLTPAEAVAASGNQAPGHLRIDGLKGVDADRIPNLIPEEPWRAHGHLDKFKDILRVEWAKDADPGTAEVFYADGSTDLIKQGDLLCVERPILSTPEKVEANKAKINDETLPIEVRRAALRLHNRYQTEASTTPAAEKQPAEGDPYDGQDWATHGVSVWITNDGSFYDTACNFAKMDETGSQLRDYLFRLLFARESLADQERKRLTADDMHTLRLVVADLDDNQHGATAREMFDRVNWAEIRSDLLR
jgi:hypothetical protein